MKELKPIALVDAAYLAGLFDGEGCVGIYRKMASSFVSSKGHYLSISISNTSRDVLVHVTRTYGGRWGDCGQTRGNRRKLWQWQAQSREAAHILRALLPFLIVKRSQAEIALKFAARCARTGRQPRAKTFPPTMPRLRATEIAQRERLARQLKRLKHQH